MSKSLKLKGNNYIDSSGVVHEREQLKTFLDKKVISTQTDTDGNKMTLERIGNIVHWYTSKYVEKELLSNFTIPQEYAPSNTMQIDCRAYYRETDVYWQPRQISNTTNNLRKFRVESITGSEDTNYAYVSFNLIWFI